MSKVTMVLPITQTDIREMLQAVEQSGFASFELSFGDVRVAVGRADVPVAPVDSTGAKAVTAPILGLFRAMVTVGAVVEPDTVVATLRVLEAVTEVKAGLSGRVAVIEVKDGELAEFGQALLRVQEAAP